MAHHDVCHGEPTAIEVRSALHRLLAAPCFVQSPKLSAFLRFVVEATLTGSGNRIKAYTIAVDALGRQPSFDPNIDAIVRVDAIRIRRAIERYYATDGAGAEIVIDLPKGRYVPTFRHRVPLSVPRRLGLRVEESKRLPWPRQMSHYLQLEKKAAVV